jgi:hypothetical protein
MAATGSADVPAHSGFVRRPHLITVIEPTVDESFAIDRSSGFEISWTPVEDGLVGVVVVSADMNVSCFVAAGLGHFTVPADLLERLQPTDAETLGRLSITQSNSAVLRPKGWEIGLYASGPVASVPVALR